MSENPLPSGRQPTHSVRTFAREAAALGGTRVLERPVKRTWKDFFYPKILSALTPDYWKTRFVKDVTAGVIVGIVALPLAIAFAVASGLSPDKGLVTAVVAGFLISFLGGSRVQIGGPTGAFIVIVSGISAQYGFEGLLVSTMLAGVFLVCFGLLRLGNVIKFIPHPVIVGFTSGIAVTIFTTQVGDALGFGLKGESGTFIASWGEYFRRLGEANPWSVLLAAATIVAMQAGRRFFPRVPGSLVAILAATAATALFHLPVDTIGSRFSDIPTSFHFALPDFDLSRLVDYIQPAFTIALLGAIESLLSAVVADGMIGGNHRSNTELIAQGVANIVTPLVGGIPATGAIARTATNVRSGGRTPVAGMVHAVVLLVIMLALGDYAELIPMPCLAGILMVVAYNMSEWRSFALVLKAPVYEVVVLLATFFLTVLVDLTAAIEIGMILAAFLFIQRMARMGTVFSITSSGGTERGADIVEDYRDIPKEIDVFEVSGPFFFAASRQYQQVLQTLGIASRVVIIRMRHVPFVDATGIRNFRDSVLFMKRMGRTALLCGVREPVMKDLRRFGVIDLVGMENIFPSFSSALARAKEMAAEEKRENAAG
ncbi:MAG: SulP family inorganic anion transporter [Planctomycetota bacterium]|jgi:SulP family sulfate permease|nr:SulP family inorganic anion transporter [Planctomycetota bacterium]